MQTRKRTHSLDCFCMCLFVCFALHFFLYKNTFYKNIQAEIRKKIRILLRNAQAEIQNIFLKTFNFGRIASEKKEGIFLL